MAQGLLITRDRLNNQVCCSLPETELNHTVILPGRATLQTGCYFVVHNSCTLPEPDLSSLLLCFPPKFHPLLKGDWMDAGGYSPFRDRTASWPSQMLGRYICTSFKPPPQHSPIQHQWFEFFGDIFLIWTKRLNHFRERRQIHHVKSRTMYKHWSCSCFICHIYSYYWFAESQLWQL